MAETIREVMTADPITVDADDSIEDASKQMRKYDIGDVIVVEEGRLVGILTDRDIVIRGLAMGLSVRAAVREVSTEAPRSLRPDDSIADAVDRMRDAAVRRVPVVVDDKPIGIVSLGDLAKEMDPASALGEISSAQPTK